MTIFQICCLIWTLIVFPLLIFAAVVLGANLYAKGQSHTIPTIWTPRFSASKNGQAEQPARGRITLPEV